MSGAEPAHAPYVRFMRNALLVDLLMGVIVCALSWKQGWTSVEESTNAILGAGAVLLGLAVLPLVAPLIETMLRPAGWYLPDLQQARTEAMREERSPMQTRITLTLLAAGAVPVAYALAVSLLFLA